jgi:hypothetical protein
MKPQESTERRNPESTQNSEKKKKNAGSFFQVESIYDVQTAIITNGTTTE